MIYFILLLFIPIHPFFILFLLSYSIFYHFVNIYNFIPYGYGIFVCYVNKKGRNIHFKHLCLLACIKKTSTRLSGGFSYVGIVLYSLLMRKRINLVCQLCLCYLLPLKGFSNSSVSYSPSESSLN